MKTFNSFNGDFCKDRLLERQIKDQYSKVMELKNKYKEIISELKVRLGWEEQAETLALLLSEIEALHDCEMSHILSRGIEMGRAIERLNR